MFCQQVGNLTPHTAGVINGRGYAALWVISADSTILVNILEFDSL